MKAAVLQGIDQDLVIEEFQTPDVGDDDVLLQVAACGVCHTDLKVQDGSIPSSPPTVLGHEVSGTVVGAGKNQREHFKDGDHVTVGMRFSCGRCEYCTSGLSNLCNRRPTGSLFRRADGGTATRWNVGGFTQLLSVPGYMVFHLPEGVGLEESCIVGCRVTTAYNAVKNGAHLAPGESAMVIGCGGVGLNIIQMLRLFGAYPIVAVDVVGSKLEAALAYGASHIVNASSEDPVEATIEITKGGARKTFEAIGNPVTADQIVRATRPTGTATIVGSMPPGPITINDSRFAFKEIKVTGVAMRRTSDVTEVLDLVAQGRIELGSFITKRYGFEQINEAIEDVHHGNVLMGITLWNQ